MIKQAQFQARRANLAAQLPVDSIAFIPSAREQLRNGDVHHRFRQDSDFYYLTGFEEPDAILVIFSGDRAETVLFNRPHDAVAEQWVGKRLGQAAAPEALRVSHAFSMEDFEQELPALLENKQAVYFPKGHCPRLGGRVIDAWQKTDAELSDIRPLVAEMRLIKDEDELALIQKAVDVSILAHLRGMQTCSELRYEYELEAEIAYQMIRGGCRSYAYDPIVAAGNNACTLHYVNNDQPLRKGSLVLVDAGGEYQNYAADITRTYPVNGQFSAEQKAIYNLVLAAQEAVFAKIRPGLLWDEMQQETVRVLTEGLVDLGILKGSVDSLIEQGAYKAFYMHRVGHWLGLDVHDCGHCVTPNQARALTENMVFTVEPGLYIRDKMPGVNSRWWGIGVRIEDDICVTQNGYKNLSGVLPALADDVEACIRG